jgi:hypothetical protein
MIDAGRPFDQDDDDNDDDEGSIFTPDHPGIIRKIEDQWRALDRVAAELFPGQAIGPDQREEVAKRVVVAWSDMVMRVEKGNIDVADHEARQRRTARKEPAVWAAVRPGGVLYLPRFILPDQDTHPWALALTRALNAWLETRMADRHEFASESFRRRLWTLQDQLDRMGYAVLRDPADD